MSILVLDVGSSSVRGSIVTGAGLPLEVHKRAITSLRPRPGIVEFDPQEIATAVLEVAEASIAVAGPVTSVGISAQRASTVLWERASQVAVGPGLGWQDIRTTGQCLALQARGLRLQPNQSATKLTWLLDHYGRNGDRDLCFGTIESYVAAVLSKGAVHVTDFSNAAVTGLLANDASGWDASVLEALSIPEELLPTLVESMGDLGEATALEGSPIIRALIGDQQASLIGQGCLRFGEAKATFGTGAMLDCNVGRERPSFSVRGENGTFPIVAWKASGELHWGVEAAMLSAGSCVSWLCDGLGLIDSPAESEALASSVRDAGGVIFVPALGGMGTPIWDFGARGCLIGIDSSTTRAQIVYAVLEGVAQRGADLLEAVESDVGVSFDRLRVDGGMSDNALFVQLLANATGRSIELATTIEATTLGAAYLAGAADQTWKSLEDATSSITPRGVFEPTGRSDRERWLTAREHALRAVPALSALSF